MASSRRLCRKFVIILLLVFCYGFTGIGSADLSSSGKWIQVAENISPTLAKWNYGTAVFHDRLWVIGGADLSGKFSYHNGTPVLTGGRTVDNASEVWSSSDGKNWSLVVGNASFGPRMSPGLVVFRNRLWVIGGTGLDDVWSSADGEKWVLETAHAGFSPRGDAGIVVFHDRLWVIAGGANSAVHANMTDDVWSSPDGRSWTRETDHTGFGPRFGYGVVVYHDKIWMIGGKSDIVTHNPQDGSTEQSDGGSQDVWRSENGANWTLLGDNLSFSRMEFSPVSVLDDKLWLAGGGWADVTVLQPAPGTFTPPVYYYNEVWSSNDGINWSVQTENAGFSPGYRPVITFRNAIWRIGSDVWTMPLRISGSEAPPPESPEMAANPTISEVPPTSPASSYKPVKSGLPTQAGTDPGIIFGNLVISIGFVIAVRVFKKG